MAEQQTKPQRPAPATALPPKPDRRAEVLSLARELFAALVTSPGCASKAVDHLAYDAVAKAKVFYDVADEHLK